MGEGASGAKDLKKLQGEVNGVFKKVLQLEHNVELLQTELRSHRREMEVTLEQMEKLFNNISIKLEKWF